MKKKNSAWDSPDAREAVKNRLNAILKETYAKIDATFEERGLCYKLDDTAQDLLYDVFDGADDGLFNDEAIDSVFENWICPIQDMAERLEKACAKCDAELKDAQERLARVKKLLSRAKSGRA